MMQVSLKKVREVPEATEVQKAQELERFKRLVVSSCLAVEGLCPKTPIPKKQISNIFV